MRKIFKDRLRVIENQITHELFDSLIKKYTVKQFDKIIRFSTFSRDAKFYNRPSFTITDERYYLITICCEEESKIESFADLKKAIKCLSDDLPVPPLIDDDIQTAIKIFSSGGLADVLD
ncbi:hypothetical protein RF11_09633 [Thelohanellus kitauei]|uniref:Uncharacterized protein n=1 Tax=Thelohanellus kitauei TaxID=669202 RepID=A0A0C2JYT1_THEKT|nr:hypothetical protein RF11_09633 [Thelohanellus kitauei]